MRVDGGARAVEGVFVVANPAGGGADQLPSLRSQIDALGVDAQWLETAEDDPGTGQTREAIARGASLVIAAGGDGTVRACVEALKGSDVHLGIVPLGTGNLLARNLNIPSDPHQALEVALYGETMRIDVGSVNGEAFAVMSGMGLDAETMRAADDDLKASVGPAAYVIAGFRQLRSRPFTVALDADGNSTEHRVTMLLVGSVGRLPAGINMFPDAESYDGLLHVLVVEARSGWDWLKSFGALLLRRHHAGPLTRLTCTELTASLGHQRIYELDGEERPAVDRLNFSITPRAVAVRVPAKRIA